MTGTVKMTKEEMEAMRINAMLNGADLSGVAEDSDDDIDIEIVEEEKSKKKGRAKQEKKENKPKLEVVPTLSAYEKIKSSTLKVTFNKHDIPYKEQLWAIPPRTVEYQVELLKYPKPCSDAAEVFHGKSVEEKEKARSGEVRYFKVVTYDSVPMQVVTLGYARLSVNNNGNFTFKVKTFDDKIKANNANPEKVKKNIESTMKSIIAK